VWVLSCLTRRRPSPFSLTPGWYGSTRGVPGPSSHVRTSGLPAPRSSASTTGPVPCAAAFATSSLAMSTAALRTEAGSPQESQVWTVKARALRADVRVAVSWMRRTSARAAASVSSGALRLLLGPQPRQRLAGATDAAARQVVRRLVAGQRVRGRLELQVQLAQQPAGRRPYRCGVLLHGCSSGATGRSALRAPSWWDGTEVLPGRPAARPAAGTGGTRTVNP
jgi:hypothetical protein